MFLFSDADVTVRIYPQNDYITYPIFFKGFVLIDFMT